MASATALRPEVLKACSIAPATAARVSRPLSRSRPPITPEKGAEQRPQTGSEGPKGLSLEEGVTDTFFKHGFDIDKGCIAAKGRIASASAGADVEGCRVAQNFFGLGGEFRAGPMQHQAGQELDLRKVGLDPADLAVPEKWIGARRSSVRSRCRSGRRSSGLRSTARRTASTDCTRTTERGASGGAGSALDPRAVDPIRAQLQRGFAPRAR